MKKVLMLAIAALSVIGMAGNAFAAGSTSADVTVNATVGSVGCQAISPGVLSLDVADPSNPGTVYSTGNNSTVQCQNGLAATVTAYSAGSAVTDGTGSLNGVLTGPGNINYVLKYNAAITGTGFGGAARNREVIHAAGSATQGAQITPLGDEATGAYSDTVTITVAY